MNMFAGKTALITGGAGDIAKSLAKAFLKEGAGVMLVDIDEKGLKRVADDTKSATIKYFKADVTSPDDTKAYVEKTIEEFGSIDVFIDNAAIEGEVKPIADYPLEVFEKVINVNIKGMWLGLKYVIPAMEKNGGGSIVIMSSVAGIRGTANVSPYVMSKHAIIGMMKTAALECAPKNIRVNCINPAPIESRMMDSLEEGFSDDPKKAKEQFSQMIPLARYGTTEEVAEMVLFISGENASYCTGGVYMIDGGMTVS